MSDKERIARERDWVKARFECTVDSVFQELVSVVDSDVKSFNKLSGRNACEIKRVEDRKTTVALAERVAFVSTDGKVIRAGILHGRSSLSDFEIRAEWNEADLHCDLFIEGEKVSMHRASQKIIGSVLFPRGHS
ncbi:MAG: hypothetical protein OXG16_12685 [Rhodospirillales bacterium]|nr:hypothetical protein [Rhodospirillales bacterium]